MGKKVNSSNSFIGYVTITRLLINTTLWFYFYQHSGIQDDSVVSTWISSDPLVKVSFLQVLRDSCSSQCLGQTGSPYEAGKLFPENLSLAVSIKLYLKPLLLLGGQIVQ